MLERSKKVDEFLEFQQECDAKMETVYKNYQERQDRENKMKVPFIDSIRVTMKRLKEFEKMPWTKGDSFRFAEHDYNWFLDKIASNRDSKYKGC